MEAIFRYSINYGEISKASECNCFAIFYSPRNVPKNKNKAAMPANGR